MSASLLATPRTHWLSGWFLRLFARPVVRIDGTDHAVQWGRTLTVGVEPGRRRIAVGARYFGAAEPVGMEVATVAVNEGSQVALSAKNGPLNHQPFTVTETR